MKTHFFKTSHDSLGPIAVGVGADKVSAMLDAVSKIEGRRGPEGDALAAMLRQGVACEVLPQATRFADHGEHGFTTRETAIMAEIVTSDSQAHALAEGATCGVHDLLSQLKEKYSRKAIGAGLNLSLVDWAEVLAELPAPQQIHRELGVHPLLASPPEIEAGSGRVIPDEVRGVLERCAIDGLHLYLPQARLDRKLYAQVDDVLRALGGKWVGRKVQAHVFEEDPQPLLDIAISTGRFVKPQDFGYFPTPDDLVKQVIELADLRPGMKALEPSAGRGAIAVRMAEILGFDNVTVVELLNGNARKLVEAGFSAVNRVDFLSLDPVPIYDRIIMNPPFSRLTDVDHVMHASRFLKPDGRLVSFTAPSWEFNSARKAQDFRDFFSECSGEVLDIEAGAFASSGTNVATRIITMDAENFPWYREAPARHRQAA